MALWGIGKSNTSTGTKKVDGSDRRDIILTGKADTEIAAKGGNDIVLAGRGDDTIKAGSGNDFVSAGRGDDVIHDGAGSDIVLAGRGNDTVVYVAEDNVGASDFFDGGRGQDTIRLALTSQEWTDALRNEVLAYLQFIDDNTRWNGETGLRAFKFESLGLTLTRFENIEIFVDGDLVDPNMGDDNTPPTVGSPLALELSEEAVETTFSLLEGAEDADGDALSVQSLTLENGDPSGIRLSSDGNSLIIDPTAYDALAEGQTEIVQYSYEIADGRGGIVAQSATITITGTNDAATIAGELAGGVVEDGTLTATGLLVITDPDTGEAAVVPQVGSTGAFGTFDITSAGAWTYTLDNANAQVQALAAGAELTDSFTVTSVDGTATETVTVTITGTNDAAMITGQLAGGVTEDDTLTATGLVVVTDPDAGEAEVVPQVGSTGAFGTFDITSAGAWTYTLDNANAQVQALAAGAELTDSFTVTSVDGTATETVTVTITGADEDNTPPTVGSPLALELSEEAVETTFSLLEGAEDADGDALSVQSLTLENGDPSGIRLSSDGNSLIIDPTAYNALAEGQTEIVQYSYEIADGRGGIVAQSAIITITGANDAATIAGELAGGVTEDGTLTATGLVVVTDPDAGEAEVVPQVGSTGAFGTFDITSAGAWTYTLDNANAQVQALAAGAELTDSFTVTSVDGTATETVTVTITGTNDAAMITGTEGLSVREDGPLEDTLVVSVTDVDSGEAALQASSITGTFGSFDVRSDGTVRYTLNNSLQAVQDLNDGDTLQDSATLTSIDGTTSEIFVDIQGRDEPIVEPIAVSLQLSVDTGNSSNDALTSSLGFEGDIDGVSQLRSATLELAADDGLIPVDLIPLLTPTGGFAVTSQQIEDAATLAGVQADDGLYQVKVTLITLSGDFIQSDLLEIVFDSTAPQLVGGPESEDFRTQAPDRLLLSFDEDVDPLSLSVADIVLTDDEGRDVSVGSVIGNGPTGLQINLAETLPSATYSLQIGGAGIADAAGNRTTIETAIVFDVASPTRIVSISPSDSSDLVNLDRKVTVHFDRAVDAASITSESIQVLGPDGAEIDGSLRVSSNGLKASFFLADGVLLPASSTVRVLIDGEQILDTAGQRIDADGDGIAGGISLTDFETVSVTRVPDTNIEGFIFDSNRRGPDGEDLPLEGVIVSVVGLPDVSTTTDENGRFFLEDLPVPDAYLEFDASQVTAETGFRYGTVTKPVHTTAGQTKQMSLEDGTPFNIFLASLSTEDSVELNETGDTTVGIGANGIANLANLFPDVDPAEWENLSVTVPGNSLFFDDGTPATEATILAFQPDRIPAPLPQGYDPDFVFTLTAGGAENFDSNAQVTFPNLDGLAPGARRPILSFDHDAGKWVQTGTAVVSEDGTHLTTEGEGGVNTLGWKFVGTSPVSQHTEGPSSVEPSGGSGGPSVPPNIEPSPIGLPNNRLDGLKAAGGNVTDGVRNIVSGTGKILLAEVNVADAISPDELAPPVAIATAGLQTTISLTLTAIDPESEVDEFAIADAGVSTAASLTPGVDVVSSGVSAVRNVVGGLKDGVEARGNFVDALGNLVYAATAPSASETFGPRAQDIAANGPVGPSAQDINRALNPDAFQQNSIAPQSIQAPQVQNLSVLSLDGPAPLVLQNPITLNAEPNVLLPLAESTIEAANDQIIGPGRFANISDVQKLQAYLLKDGRRISDELDPNSEAAQAVDAALSGIETLLPAFDLAVESAASVFRAAVGAIDVDSLTDEEAVAAFQAAQTAYSVAVETAFNTFSQDFAARAEDVDDAIEATFNASNALALATLDLFEERLSLYEQQEEIGEDYIDLVQELGSIDGSEASLLALQASSNALLAKITTFEADLAAAGFSSVQELDEQTVLDYERLADQLSLVAVPFVDSYNPVFAQAILGDGTVIRARLAPGEEFSINGPSGTDATIRFFDPATNLFSERTITFGEDNTTGQSILSTVLTLDTDGDGIPDLGEEVIGTNPNDADSDGDGTLDGLEVRTSGVSATDSGTLPTGIVSSVAFAGEAQDVAIVSSASAPGQVFALVAAGSGGLAIIDVGQSTAPSLVRQLSLPGEATSVNVDPTTGLALVAAGDAGLHVVDVGTPSAPLLLRTIQDVGPVNAIATLGGPAVVGGDASIALIDPASGAVLDQIGIDQPSRDVSIDDLLVVGDIVYVTERGPRVDIVQDRFEIPVSLVTYQLQAGTLVELDRLTLPVPIERKITPEPLKIFVDGTIAYISSGLEVTDVSDFRPQERGGYLTISVADPDNLSVISAVDTGENQAGNFETITNGSGLAIVASGSFGLQLYDASDPSNTFDPITGFDTPGTALGVALADGLAYVADGAAGLQIVNISSGGVDNAAPEVSISVSADADIDPVADGIQVAAGSLIPIALNLVDDGQINRVTVLVDGEAQSVLLNPPFIPSVFAPTLDDGETSRTITIEISAQDAGGLVTRSEALNVEIVEDTVGPAVLSLSLTEGQSILPGRAITVEVVFDSFVDPDTVTADLLTASPQNGAAIPASNVTLQSQADGTSVAIFVVDALPVGDYTFQFDPTTITDLSGNSSETGQLTRAATVEDFTNVWAANLPGVWSTAANWSAGVVPGAADRALVDVSAGVRAAVESAADPLNALLITGEGTFEVDVAEFGTVFEVQSLTNEGTVLLRDGRVDVQANLVNDSTLEIIGGGDLDYDGTQIVNRGLIRLADGTFGAGATGAGSIDIRANNVVLSGGGTIEMDIASTSFRSLSGISDPSQQTFINADNVITGTGTIGPEFGFVNGTNGVLRAEAGDRLVVGVSSFENDGLAVAELGGELVVRSQQFLGSPFAFRSSAVLDGFDGVFEANGGVIDLSDTLVRGGTFRSSTVDGQAGLIKIGDADGRFSPNFTGFEGVLSTIVAEADFEVSGAINITGNLSNTGTLRLLDGATVQAGSFFFEFLFTQLFGGGTVLMETGSTIQVGASFTEFEDPGESEDDGEPDFLDAYIVQVGSFGIQDHIVEGAGIIGISDVAAYLEEQIGFSDDPFFLTLVDLDLYDPDNFSGDFFEVAASRLLDVNVLNDSKLIANVSGETLQVANAELFNLGEIRADGGTLEVLNGSFLNRGEINVDGGGEFRYVQSNSFFGADSFFNDGSITVFDGTFQTDVMLDNLGEVSILGGFATFFDGISSFPGFDSSDPRSFSIGDAEVEIFGSVSAETVFDLSEGAAILRLDSTLNFEGDFRSFFDDDEIIFNSLDAEFAVLDAQVSGDDIRLTIDDGFETFATTIFDVADQVVGEATDLFDLFDNGGSLSLTTSLADPFA